MRKLSELFESKGIRFYPAERLSLDNYLYEPYQDRNEVFDNNRVFETQPFESRKKLPPPYDESLFQFFLDGSRKTYKIGDIITTDNKFVPVLAGQIGAACCKREQDKKLSLFVHKRRNVLMLFDSIQNDDYNEIKDTLEKEKIKDISIEIEKYQFNKLKDEAPTNAALAKIHRLMGNIEISLLTDIVNKNVLKTDEMLIFDGSLQFLAQEFDPAIFYNVVGISKSFNPNLTGILKGKKIQIGAMLTELAFGERTPVYKYDNGSIKNTIGAWYLRIRAKEEVRNPLEGIIKIEKMALDGNLDRGFESDLIDNISRSILAERNPTCHGNDTRWANHLYPIYLTERFLKSSFIGDYYFMNIF